MEIQAAVFDSALLTNPIRQQLALNDGILQKAIMSKYSTWYLISNFLLRHILGFLGFDNRLMDNQAHT